MSKGERRIRRMKKATVSDLRYSFLKIERMLRAGQEVEITKRGRVIAHLLPDTEPDRPDFLARLKTIYGNKKLRVTGAELISQEREDR
jgi:antitoxin (DNA-binding transcriptional repressor) of toxin-antitoxin stability system